jgi:Glycosyl transferase family 2
MANCFFSLHDQVTELRYPNNLQAHIELLFGAQTKPVAQPASHLICVQQIASDRFTVSGDTECSAERELSLAELTDVLLEDVVRSLIYDLDSAVALHAASVGWNDKSVLVAGPTGSGKTSLAGWLVANGFDFLSDELVVLPGTGRTTLSFPRPLLAKPGAEQFIELLTLDGRGQAIATGANTFIALQRPGSAGPSKRQAGLLIFPQFVTGSELALAPISPALVGLRLMQSNLNARNLPDHGMAILSALARNIPAVVLTYGNYDQLEGVADNLIKMVLEGNVSTSAFKRIASAFGASTSMAVPGSTRFDGIASALTPVPEPTPRKPPKKVTIGMATYDDFDGTYFTLQAIRMYHPEILDDAELLVVDNHPDGRAARALKDLETWIPNYRYVPMGGVSGTAIRDAVFREATGEIVVCLDCHVFVVPGALKRLIDYFDANPGTADLLQGPLLYDNLKTISTHFEPNWREGMYGTWESSSDGADPELPPFEIPMQGLGLFACRREAWPGFNPAFRGFGGEEGYIHEKFRRAGGRTLCLPFLRWMHRFHRPLGIPYANTWNDRVRNYWIGFQELGWDTAPIAEHFKAFLGNGVGVRMVEDMEKEFPDSRTNTRTATDQVSARRSARSSG